MSAGGLVGLALVLLANALISRPAAKTRPPGCLPYFLIPREIVCAQRIYYTNPDGSRVPLGERSSFYPMPKPPQEHP